MSFPFMILSWRFVFYFITFVIFLLFSNSSYFTYSPFGIYLLRILVAKWHWSSKMFARIVSIAAATASVRFDCQLQSNSQTQSFDTLFREKKHYNLHNKSHDFDLETWIFGAEFVDLSNAKKYDWSFKCI